MKPSLSGAGWAIRRASATACSMAISSSSGGRNRAAFTIRLMSMNRSTAAGSATRIRVSSIASRAADAARSGLPPVLRRGASTSDNDHARLLRFCQLPSAATACRYQPTATSVSLICSAIGR